MFVGIGSADNCQVCYFSSNPIINQINLEFKRCQVSSRTAQGLYIIEPLKKDPQ